MFRHSLVVLALAASTAPACTAFVVPVTVPHAAGVSSTTMALKGPGRSPSPLSKAARIVSKVLFTRPGTFKSVKGNGDGMMGGGAGGGAGGLGSFAMGDDEDENPLAMMGVLAALKGGLGGLWDSYNSALDQNPIIVKACTSLVGFSVGDILAQQGTKKSKEDQFSYERLARMAAFGFLFHGTISHFFYNALDSALPGTAAMTVIQKVLIDQVLWAPVFTIVFFTWLGVTSGASIDEIITKIKNDLVKGVVGSWTVWPLAHTINFRFIPTEQRLLYINSIQIFYNVFLSIIGSK